MLVVGVVIETNRADKWRFRYTPPDSMPNPIYTAEERIADERRRLRIIDAVLDNPDLANDIGHFQFFARLTDVEHFVRNLKHQAPKGDKDPAGQREVLVAAAVVALRMASELDRGKFLRLAREQQAAERVASEPGADLPPA